MQFLGGDVHPTIGPSPYEQPVRGMHQALINRLSLCNKTSEPCVLDEARQGAMKGW